MSVEAIDKHYDLNAARAALLRIENATNIVRSVVEGFGQRPLEAAREEISRLRAENERLWKRLEAIAVWLEANQPDVFQRGIWDALAALSPAPTGTTNGSEVPG